MNFLLYWPSWAQIVFVVVVFSGLSVLGLYVVRVLVPLERLKQNHEVAGFTFGVVGAFYGLLLAFVIVAAWERFDRATEQVQSEGIALISLYRLSKGFAEPVATDMRTALRSYTHGLIDKEWPDMANYRFQQMNDSMGPLPLWQIVTNYKPQDTHQQMLVDKSFDQLSQLSAAVSMRYLYCKDDLPSVVWVVIYAGLLITIGFSYFFGLEDFSLPSPDVCDLLQPFGHYPPGDCRTGASLPGIRDSFGSTVYLCVDANGRHGQDRPWRGPWPPANGAVRRGCFSAARLIRDRRNGPLPVRPQRWSHRPK